MDHMSVIMTAIGIDLGTTNSCVAAWIDGKVEIIANDQGNRTTPSYVAYQDNECLIGDAARYQAALNPTNTIYDAKRLIGRRYQDPVVCADIKSWPFRVVDVDGFPRFEIRTGDKTRLLAPEEISASILLKLKQAAAARLGCEVRDAVITVPAYFTDAQRQATRDAGRIAGLNVIRIINEPTAAALAYGLNKRQATETKVLIFDCGGGTHDVSLLAIENGLFQVLATAGNSHLGGQDINNRMVDWCVADIQRRLGIDVKSSAKALKRLSLACERAKHVLSTATAATIDVDSLHDGRDYQTRISRARFEELCQDIFEKTMEPVRQVLADANCQPEQIHEIVLVGGSTRIPKIREMLSTFFQNRTLNESVNPDEAVAYGAAVEAAILTNPDAASGKLDGIVLLDVTPLTLGIEAVGGLMIPIIKRNETIPCKKSRAFTTHTDNQTRVTIEIFEGERKFTKDNNRLGDFHLDDIHPAERGTPRIEVTFDIDANGILNVTASDQNSMRSNNLTITRSRNQFTEQQIQELVNEAQKFEQQDMHRRNGIDAYNTLENYTYHLRKCLSDVKCAGKITDAERENLQSLLTETMKFLEENPTAEAGESDQHRKRLEDVWHPIVVRFQQTEQPEQPDATPHEETAQKQPAISRPIMSRRPPQPQAHPN